MLKRRNCLLVALNKMQVEIISNTIVFSLSLGFFRFAYKHDKKAWTCDVTNPSL